MVGIARRLMCLFGLHRWAAHKLPEDWKTRGLFAHRCECCAVVTLDIAKG